MDGNYHRCGTLKDSYPYTRAQALAMRLAQLGPHWLHVACSGCTKTALVPCRMLATKLGASTQLRDVLPRPHCQDCDGRPTSVELQEGSGGGGLERVKPWRLGLT